MRKPMSAKTYWPANRLAYWRVTSTRGNQIGGGSGGQDRSQLYMELRFKGNPIDPAPWLKRG